MMRGEAAILIDGVDEIPETHRSLVREWIEDLTNKYGKSRFVVSGRPSAAHDDWLENFTTCTLDPMSEESVI